MAIRPILPAMARARKEHTYSNRAHDRSPLQDVRCDQGVVADVSLTGMQVHCEGASPVGVNEPVRFSIRTHGKQVSLEGNVVWVRRPGKVFGPSRFGVRFIEPGGAAAKALMHLAKIGVWPEKSSQAEPTGTDSPDEPTGQETFEIPEGGAGISIEVIDLYELLEIEPGADMDAVRSAYRKQVRRWHPDMCDEPDASIRLEMVVGAGRVLMDDEARKQYDLRRAG